MVIKSESSTDGSSIVTNSSVRVAIQGYQGAFHEIAARFGFTNRSIDVVPNHTFEELVKMVEDQEKVDVGMMAIENTLGGSLMYNYSLLHESNLRIVGEVFLRIKQNLMALPGTTIDDLKEVRSHPMAIAQCRAFFRRFPSIRLVETADTALSAREIQEKQLPDVGAIASTLAADLYKLEIIGEGIETNKKNHTRFLVLQPDEVPFYNPDADKVSLCFATDHEVGSLYKVLGVLSAYNVNLTKIQSTPIIGSPWKYRFFVDFIQEGHITFEQAIEAIKPLTKDLKILGIYARGKHYEY